MFLRKLTEIVAYILIVLATATGLFTLGTTLLKAPPPAKLVSLMGITLLIYGSVLAVKFIQDLFKNSKEEEK